MASEEQNDRSYIALARRKAQDRSVVLVLTGLILLLPPLGAVSLAEGSIFELPVPLVYLFSVWAALIAIAALLSRPLGEDGELADVVPDRQDTSA